MKPVKLVLVSPQSYRPILVTKMARELSPPMGLLYLASAVRDECDVSIVDVQVRRWTIGEAVSAIVAQLPDVVGISVNYTTTMPSAMELARQLRQRAPEVLIIGGGNSATFETATLLRNAPFDAVVLREGESTLREVVKRFSAHMDISGIPGVAYRDGDGVKIQPFAGYAASLDDLAFPRFSDLEQPEHYLKAIVSSRGCTYGCIYCSTQQMWKRWRGRSPENLMAEADGLIEAHQPKQVAFIDDEFTTDRARVRGICGGLIERGVPFKWSFAARLEHTDEELLDWVSAAGCESIFFGIESGSDSVLAQLRRRYTIADVDRIVALCRARGILPILSFMIGNPHETSRDVETTLAVLRCVGTHRLNLSVFTPFPGTPVHTHASRFGVSLTAPKRVINDDTGDVFHCTQHLSADQIRGYWLEGVGIIMRRAREAAGGGA